VTAPAAAAPARLVLPVKLRRLQRLELLRAFVDHGLAAVTLLAAGAQGLAGHGLDRVLAVAEVVASAWLLLLLGRHARHVLGRPTHADDAPVAPIPDDEIPPEMEGIDWTGVAASLLIGLEIWHRWARTGHIVRPFVLSAVFTFAMALGGRAIVARRVRPHFRNRMPRLVLTSDGFDYRASRRRHLAARWADVERVVELSPDVVHLRLRDGRAFVLRASDHVQGRGLVAAVREALPRLAPMLGSG
jgi:hypothetical protein